MNKRARYARRILRDHRRAVMRWWMNGPEGHHHRYYPYHHKTRKFDWGTESTPWGCPHCKGGKFIARTMGPTRGGY